MMVCTDWRRDTQYPSDGCVDIASALLSDLNAPCPRNARPNTASAPDRDRGACWRGIYLLWNADCVDRKSALITPRTFLSLPQKKIWGGPFSYTQNLPASKAKLLNNNFIRKFNNFLPSPFLAMNTMLSHCSPSPVGLIQLEGPSDPS